MGRIRAVKKEAREKAFLTAEITVSINEANYMMRVHMSIHKPHHESKLPVVEQE